MIDRSAARRDPGRLTRLVILVFLGLVGAAESKPPDWANDAIWYNIFPERFRNGDPSNDPTVTSLADTWPYEPEAKAGWQVSPWTSDWYRAQPWEKANGRGFYYNAQLRRYGGDLQGIIDKLDYLKSLGVNALYLNPVFESPSLHKYGAAMYHHIDNHFGPDPEGDAKIWAEEDPAKPETWQWTAADKLFLKLIAEVHKRDMRIIIDGVFNHVGIPFWALQRAKKDGPGGTYEDWFTITRWDDPDTPKDEFEYQGWAGIRGLPVFKHGPTGPNDAVKAHFRAVVRRWMDPNDDGDPSDGIDGWRLDVAAEVPVEFWKEFRTWVRAINPEAYLTGEIWWQDYKTHQLKNAAPWLRNGDVFDSVMNYRFADTTYQFFNQTEGTLSAEQFRRELEKIHSDYGYDTILGIQNLLDSHDTQRLASMIANPTHRLDKGGNLKGNPQYSIAPPSSDEAIARLQQIVAFQFLMPGAPFIYYGDEVGMWGADDPDCRKPMLWPDLSYSDEVETPFGNRDAKQPPIAVAPDLGRLRFYRMLCELRRTHEVLRRGSFRFLLADNETRLIAIERHSRDGQQSCVAFFNAGPKPVDLPDRFIGARKLMEPSSGLVGGSLGASGFALFFN